MMMQNIDSSSQHDVQQPGVETLRENVIEKMENFCGYQQWCWDSDDTALMEKLNQPTSTNSLAMCKKLPFEAHLVDRNSNVSSHANRKYYVITFISLLV